MRKLITTTALLILITAPAAMAQSGAGGTSTAVKNQPQGAREAPVGHRQPRAADVPSEKNLSNPNDAINREDAALDRKIKSICRGC
jgi:hypothetical protein